MKSQVSELMDGELQGREADAPLAALRNEGEAREAWRTYHLISDVMGREPLLSEGFAARVAARLADEPTALAPRRRPLGAWLPLPLAASVAAVALVGWIAFAPQPMPQAPAPVAVVPAAAPAPASPQPAKPAVARVAPPPGASDYVLAHHGYSPRISYARTVSAPSEPRKP